MLARNGFCMRYSLVKNLTLCKYSINFVLIQCKLFITSQYFYAMTKVFFKEEQRFRRWDVLGLVLFLTTWVAYHLVTQGLFSQKTDMAYAMTGLLILTVLISVLIILLNLRLKIRISEKGINFQYFPLHYKRHKICWDDIECCEIVETPLSAALSGWAISIGHGEQVFSMGGRKGLHLQLKNGEEVFIGVNDLESLRQAMREASPCLDCRS